MNKARDVFLNEGREQFVDALPETPAGKAFKKGFEYANAADSPAGYAAGKAFESGLQRTVGKRFAETIGKRVLGPGGTLVEIITEPIPNPKGYRDGQSRRPGNEHAAGLAYDALEKGYCLERHRLVPSGPTLRAGSPGGIPPSRPVPSRTPDNCASVGELTDYVNQYQREFEQIAAQERLAWEGQTWYQPFDSRNLDDLIRYAERLMNEPSLTPDMRAQLADALSEMRSERKKQGGVIPSPPIPFRIDPVHKAGQEIDSKVSSPRGQ